MMSSRRLPRWLSPRPALGASAADKLKVGFIYLGPVGDLGWTYQHDLGRQAMVKAFGDKVETTYPRERQRRPGRRALDRAARAHRPQADLHHLVRLHGADAEGRQEVSRTCKFEHATGYKRDTNLGDLFGPVLRRPLHPGHDRRARCRRPACSATSARSRSRR